MQSDLQVRKNESKNLAKGDFKFFIFLLLFIKYYTEEHKPWFYTFYLNIGACKLLMVMQLLQILIHGLDLNTEQGLFI